MDTLLTLIITLTFGAIFMYGAICLVRLIRSVAYASQDISPIDHEIMEILGKGPLTGYEICRELLVRGNPLKDREGTIYPILHGLEHKGWIDAEERQDEGRLRRYYWLKEP